MAATARDAFERFISDLRQVFAATRDPVAQAQGVARRMRELLAQPGCLDDKVGPTAGAGFGRVDLCRDAEHGHPGPGFLVMCAVLPPSRQAERSLTRGTPRCGSTGSRCLLIRPASVLLPKDVPWAEGARAHLVAGAGRG